jgi:hypothetical protein
MAKASKTLDALQDAYELIHQYALMLRGMQLDPRIPRDTKQGMWSRVEELEAWCAKVLPMLDV